jgi:PPK2 family polyphosphate:nucleotide phosphotransferase
MAKLTNTSTLAPKKFEKETTRKETQILSTRISELQKVLYAQGTKSILVILQGLDAAGKDGLISRVFSGINPLGCDVKAFKKPSEEELSHDFLWRVHQNTPSNGMINIFNRSHYEDVLVPRVEKWISLNEVKKRFVHINNFEDLLQDSGTTILKFYLHISKTEQKKRLEERLTNPEKFWKHDDGDWRTSKKWNHYMEAYEDIFKYCNPIPWTIVPSDQNWYKEYIVAKKIKETLENMNLKYPEKEKK